MNNFWFLRIIVIITIIGCQPTQNLTSTATPDLPVTITPEPIPTSGLEYPVQIIQLTGPIADPDAELSGLAWYGDKLIFLPQYPNRFGNGDGSFFMLSKQEILKYINQEHQTALEPLPVRLNAHGLRKSIKDFQGYESVVFHGDQIFLTIEAGEKEEMQGYLVSGTIAPDASEITLDVEKVVEIPLPIQSEGRSYETMLIMDDALIILFEANGSTINQNPVAQVFSFDLNFLRTIPFPNLEFRLTDATPADNNSFWVLNQLTSDNPEFAIGDDVLMEKYGKGESHSEQDQVERLVKLNYLTDTIVFADVAPIQLMLDGNTARKWEGLALLDEFGFLLVTDEEPDTIFAFVKMP